MRKAEIIQAKVILATMFRAFPSSSNITEDNVAPFMMAIEDFDLSAIEAAAKAFIKGDVKGRNASFAPSAPELANECRIQQDRMRWQENEATKDFIEVGSETWRKLEKLTGKTFPFREITVDGRSIRGWSFPKGQVAEAKLLELPAPRADLAIEAVSGKLKGMSEHG